MPHFVKPLLPCPHVLTKIISSLQSGPEARLKSQNTQLQIVVTSSPKLHTHEDTMCHMTPIIFEQNGGNACSTLDPPEAPLLSLEPCSYSKHLGTHAPYPCSACPDISSIVGETWWEDPDSHRPEPINLEDLPWKTHVTPLQHWLIQEDPITVPKDCPLDTRSETIHLTSGEFKSLLKPSTRAELYAASLSLSPQTAALAASLASSLEAQRRESGASPKVFAASTVYAAAHMLSRFWIPPYSLQVLKVLHIRIEPFAHAYGKIFRSRQAFAALARDHGGEVDFLPKGCCLQPQFKDCPTDETPWGTSVGRCTGIQVGGLDVLGAFEKWAVLGAELGVADYKCTEPVS